MAEEFKAITTQEEFDAAIKSRLDRQEATIRKQYSDYDDLKKAGEGYAKKAQEDADKIASLQKELDAKGSEINSYKVRELKAKIAEEVGLPAGLRDRISGETEEDIRNDAKKLQEVFSAENRRGLPGYKPEEKPADKKEAALKGLLAGLTKE